MGRKSIRWAAFLFLSVLLMTAAAGCSPPIYTDPANIENNKEEAENMDSKAALSNRVDESQQTCFEQDGFCLFYDPQLILDVQPLSETIIAEEEGEPCVVAHPDIIHFDLSMEQAHVYITDVNAYKDATDFAAESFHQLNALISNPDSHSECIPELPLDAFYQTCDHQQFGANLKQVNFSNGSGVRFITVHGIQDFSPIDNEHLVYVFQGFTNDGDSYIKMRVRLLHSQLPDVGEVPLEVYSGDQKIVDEYFKGITDMLNASENDYSPKLEWIDNFLASLRVEKLD